MFKIENGTIKMTRGDRVAFDFSIKDYTFQEGDTIEFRVYEKKGLDKAPLISKEVEATDGETKVNITLTEQDTSIGEYLNKPKTYWYEIELNDRDTIVGFDENGAKELILYPEGVEE